MEKPLGKSDQKLEVNDFTLTKSILDIDRANLKFILLMSC